MHPRALLVPQECAARAIPRATILALQSARSQWSGIPSERKVPPLTDFNTEVSGDVAWTRYHNRAVLEMQGAESRFHWIESAVLLRQPDGSWKLDRLQSTPVSVEGAMAGS